MSLRGIYWAGLWLLSPSRGALMLKCVLIGVVVKVLSSALAVLVALVWPGMDEAIGPAPSLTRMLAEGVVFAPIIETLLMAAVFGLLGRLLCLHPAVPGTVIVVGAVLLHERTPGAALFVALAFAAMSVQYARFREVLPFATTFCGVAVTHATINALATAAVVVLAD